MTKLIMITGRVGLLDPQVAEAEGLTVDEYTDMVGESWTRSLGGEIADVYVLGSMFAEGANEEKSQRLMRALPGRKILVTEALIKREALMPEWHEVVPTITLTHCDRPLLLHEDPLYAAQGAALLVHGDAEQKDTVDRVCGAWGRWGDSYGLVNSYFLQTYAANIGAGFIEG